MRFIPARCGSFRAFVALLFLLILAGSASAAITYRVDGLNVYKSASTTIGTGTPRCLGIDISGSTAECGGTLTPGETYRFEIAISNQGTQNGIPNDFDFKDVKGVSDVLGTTGYVVANCGCTENGANKSGTPGATGQDATCDFDFTYRERNCEIQASGDSEIFYFVVKIGTNAGQGAGYFRVSQIWWGTGSDESASTTFSCPVPCTSNSECNDSNASTIDTCINAGSCSASCSNVPCSVACSTNPQCDDSNPLTTDTCLNPGTCSSSCSNTPCPVACDSNSACNDSNSLTTDICNNPGTCLSSCTHAPCTVACATNANCNDSNALTTDTCLSPGTCSASCSNTVCTVACDSNLACNDSNVLTIDICHNPATCLSSCTRTPCAIACDSNSACNDSNALTTDICQNPGTCSSSCTHTAGGCTVACDSNSACNDSNPLTLDVCLNAGTCSASCSNTACSVACAADANCSDGNALTIDRCINPGTCSASCSRTACAVACYNDVNCADTDALTIDTCQNAGTCDAICVNSACPLICSGNAQCDDSDADTTDICQNPGTCQSDCLHEPRCVISCESDSDCDDSNPVTTDVCENPGLCSSGCVNAGCAVKCSSDANCDDNKELTDDSCSNPGTCSASCSNTLPGIEINYISAPKSAYKRGEDINLVVSVISEGNPLENASVNFLDSNNRGVNLAELGNGLYGGIYSIPVGFPLGSTEFRATAAKGAEGATLSGSITSPVEITAGDLNIALIEPIGEIGQGSITLKVRVLYENGLPAQDLNLASEINGKRIELILLEPGIYSATYDASKESGELVLTVDANDSYMNSGSGSFRMPVVKSFFGIPLWFLWLLSILLAAILVLIISILTVLIFHRLKERRIEALSTRLQELAAVRNYAKAEHEKKQIDAEHYRELTEKYDAETRDVEAKLKFLREERVLSGVVHTIGSKIRAIFAKIAPTGKVSAERKIEEIDVEVMELKETMKLLEQEFLKQRIPESDFRKQMFEYRAKAHILEMRKDALQKPVVGKGTEKKR